MVVDSLSISRSSSSADHLHEDDDKGGKLRRKRAAQARSLIVIVAFVGFIFLVSIVKMNHHNKYIPSKLRRSHGGKDKAALESSSGGGGGSRQMAESSFLPPDSIYKLSVPDMQGSLVSLAQYSGLDFHQELPTNDAILEFVQDKFPQTNFPIFGLSSLVENPVYENLQRTSGKPVQWNFFKYLVDRQGKVVGVYNHHQNPLSLKEDIERILDASDPHAQKLVTH